MPTNERKLTLLFLCFPFGVISAHCFYTGKYLTGALQVLLIAFGFPIDYWKIDHLRPVAADAVVAAVVWLLIDFLRIVAGNFTDWEGQRVTQWV